MNIALASTIETLKNISAKVNLHIDITKEMINIRKEITTMK